VGDHWLLFILKLALRPFHWFWNFKDTPLTPEKISRQLRLWGSHYGHGRWGWHTRHTSTPPHKWYYWFPMCHTSHSYEAGRTRRLCTDVKIRTICSGAAAYVDRMADKLDSTVSGDDRDWLLHCMGSLCKLTESQVAALSRKPSRRLVWLGIKCIPLQINN